jgi:hypothetical protein
LRARLGEVSPGQRTAVGLALLAAGLAAPGLWYTVLQTPKLPIWPMWLFVVLGVVGLYLVLTTWHLAPWPATKDRTVVDERGGDAGTGPLGDMLTTDVTDEAKAAALARLRQLPTREDSDR